MQVPKFKEFLGEEKKDNIDKDIVVAIITKAKPNSKKQKTGSRTKKKDTTVTHIADACKKFGIKCVVLNTSNSIIAGKDEEKNTLTIFNYDGEDNEYTFIAKNTICITRAGAVEDEAGLSLTSAFQNSGAFMMNTRSAMLTCDNKLTTSLLFEKFTIPTPPTAFVSNEKNIRKSLKLIGDKFPVIVKTLTGTQGIGVIKIESYESLVSTVQALWKHDAELMIQEYMPTDYDVRTFVVDNKIFASTQRIKKSGEFRSNQHRGADVKPYKLNEKEKNIILRAARASKAYLVGVDHINYKGESYVLEVNGSPGTGAEYEGYSSEDYVEKNTGPIDGSKLAENFIKHVLNRKNWDTQSLLECGWLETVEMEDFGYVTAKLDTGNGASACAFHAEDIDIKGKTVSFSNSGKRITKPLIDTIKIYRADTPDGDGEERPVVKMNMTFHGTVYKDVLFSLDSRMRSKGEVLFNREMIKNINASVNPNRKYVLSRRLVDKT